MNRLKKLVGALLLTAVLAGCQTGNGTTTSPGGSSTAAGTSTTTITSTTAGGTTTPSAAAKETAYPYTFTSPSGETTVIEAEPQRIVSISPTFTEIVFALGASDRLVGRTDYCDYPAETSEIPSIGSMNTPSVETIVELEPDVVLVSFMEDEMMDKIMLSGATVIQLESSNTIEGSLEGMEELGRILNANEEAEELVEDLKSDMQEVSEKVQGLEPVSAYYVAGFGQGGDYTAGGDTFMNDLIEAAGAVNAGSDAEGWNYSVEKLIEKDPDFLIIGSMADLASEFKSTDPYSSLTAVKDGRLMEIDDNLIAREGPRIAEGIRLMAEIFHPEAFK